jgi:beta-glucosidase
VNPDIAEAVVGAPEHRALARQAARETLTLLKNDGALLPLSLASLRRIAVVGPNADVPLLGGYSGVPDAPVSILDGIRQRVGAAVDVIHAKGCHITLSSGWAEDAVVLPEAAEDARLIAEAVAAVQDADVILLAIGENEQTSREAWSRVHMGDRTSLELFGRQNDLVRAMVATGKPVVALLVNGRPVAASAVIDELPVVVECWWLGQEGGHAVAELLFGDYSPSGKLPISIPPSVGHLPAFYNHKPSARRGYLNDETTARFPFGFGLSYTTFALDAPRLDPAVIAVGESTAVSVTVTNTGARAGHEVVQLYIRDDVSSVTRPVKELKGFQKVLLQPGASTTVTLAITPDSLAFHDDRMRYVVEPGTFTLMVGTSSRDEDLQTLSLRVTA